MYPCWARCSSVPASIVVALRLRPGPPATVARRGIHSHCHTQYPPRVSPTRGLVPLPLGGTNGRSTGYLRSTSATFGVVGTETAVFEDLRPYLTRVCTHRIGAEGPVGVSPGTRR